MATDSLSAVAENRPPQVANDGNLEWRLAKRLDDHPQFHGHLDAVEVHVLGETLRLTGKLPSFYLKQQAQEALRGSGLTIENEIDVISCDGVSSVREQH